jgi:hypothetical protein
MRCSIALLVVACSPPPPAASPLAGMDVSMSRVAWRVKPTDPGKIEVALVVDGQVTTLGELDGEPEACAMRRAEATATELVCGADGDFVAELVTGSSTSSGVVEDLAAPTGTAHELIVRAGTREVARIPVGPSVAISVAPYALPTSPPNPSED